jgi:hypothetical protein
VKRNTHVKKLDFKTLVFIAWVICTLIEQSEAAEQAAADKLFREHVSCSWSEAGSQIVWRLRVRNSKSETGFDPSRSWFRPELHAYRPDRWKRARIAQDDGVDA